MLKIRVICVGKLKEKYWEDAVREYAKRIRPYAALEMVELKEYRLRKNAGPAEEEEVKLNEGRDILGKIGSGEYVITLEIKGKKLDSVAFSKKISDIASQGTGTLDMVIGGSLGLSKEVSARSDFKLSFSDMTFPHQMMRVVLLEQIYRAFKIARNEPYHK